ncbi:hypothetical protein C5C36_15220 [Rathayibacter sp. AY1G1]|jgi:hypothetical protein|uniref:hypothetical protein n=1 Tax=unclassified Rathayibacter TaxID=2609250 RepID=UPI000CE91B8C|nr:MULTISPECIES: hypothetical protein [unclassified Rathayibacter]PPF11463.1 hypothetical protein C5B98_08695 [Rathayibacter sp. AY1A5]PPF14215.1 hypothetical protein C5B92_15380 [Rathayibacter sp. AY1A4]PPF17334.1 hypothetical protein C5B95_14175 [Rathayibacter sp. AY1A7]PPF24915.1 hypothetical protein C5C54_15490 [Rathayibacter sp. AY1F2]PPF31572.1 hypothetical protein C5C10_14180 [Rathayibacter sp. AY1A3]
MNRTTVITALACGLLLTAAAATPAVAATSDTAGDSTRSVDEFGVLAATDGDTLLINGRAFLLE